MSAYCPNVGELDFEGELSGAAPKKKKKKKKLGAKFKGVFKKIGKGLAIASTGGLAAAAMTKAGKKVLRKVGKTKAGKTLSKGAKAIGLKVSVGKKKPAAKALKAKAAPKRAVPSPAMSKPAAKTLKKVMTKTAGDCGSKDELAALVAAQLAASLGPKLDNANALLAQFDLQRQATYEHQKLMTDSDFRRTVLSKLALGAANGNDACQKTIRVIMAGRA